MYCTVAFGFRGRLWATAAHLSSLFVFTLLMSHTSGQISDNCLITASLTLAPFAQRRLSEDVLTFTHI